MRSACGSPWPILALHILFVYRVVRLAGALLMWMSDSCTTPAGLCLSALASMHYSSTQFQRWTALLQKQRLDVIIGTGITQGRLAEFGFGFADCVHAVRKPFDSSSAWLIRALLLSAHCTTGLSSMLNANYWDASSWLDSRVPAFSRDRDAQSACVSFTGLPVDCDELERVRSFNRDVMPQLSSAGISRVRRAMNEHGLPGHVWHVGHACPDPSKTSARDAEDHGCNLFAQHEVDNSKLGPCLVSCAEAEYMGAQHIACTWGTQCIRRCKTVC